MIDDEGIARLLRRSVAAVLGCIFAVVICYYFVDRPVAFFVQDHRVNKIALFKWLTYPPPEVQEWAPVVLVVLVLSLAIGPWTKCRRVLFVACLSLIVADQFRYSMGAVAGRYWPETWHDNNPSLIGSGTYGFHPFQADDEEGSFPSGHSARIAGFLSVFWITVPRCRWLYAVIALPMLVSLVATNYHFVGDVVAGTTVGSVVGAWAVHLGSLRTTLSTG
jgi:membrane-associated phospholipid phosphatase